MAQFLYRLLEIPWMYRLSQRVFAPGADYFLSKYFQKIFKGSKGRILDVGCGPVLNTPNQGALLGLDINPDYVKSYVSKGAQKGLVASAEAMPFKNDMFDEARCFGLLHHLPDSVALNTIKEMFRCVKPQGEVIVIDGVWPEQPLLRPLAWLNCRLDRGRFMRRQRQLKELLQKAYNGSWEEFRFTHTLIGHEAVSLKLRKK